MTAIRLPLCSLDELRAELADTRASLDRLFDTPAVSPDHQRRRLERRTILQRWETGLAAQIAAMETAG